MLLFEVVYWYWMVVIVVMYDFDEVLYFGDCVLVFVLNLGCVDDEFYVDVVWLCDWCDLLLVV